MSRRPSSALSLRAALIATVLSGAAAPPGAGLPAGSPDNTGGARAVLLEQILPDLRVFVDLKPGDMPNNRLDGELPPAEVREAVRLGLLNWASVLPAIRLRLVDSASQANVVFRFRHYGAYVPGGATAVAFLPEQWNAKPDFGCGFAEPGKDAAGNSCYEGSHNLILFQSRNVAFRRVHHLDVRMHHEWLKARTDRRDTAKRFFRKPGDPAYGAWPPDRKTCVHGAAVGGVLPAWDIQCLAEKDWAALPHFDRFGDIEGPYDIASMAQHEFGHTLLGGHTGDAGTCQSLTGTDYQDFRRDPVYRENPLRRIAWDTGGTGATGAAGRVSSFSCLLNGNGMDAAFNVRGLFEADAMRLSVGSLDYRCRPVGAWKGYAHTWPKAQGFIVLTRPGGETKYVDDWRYALRLMAWPLGEGPVSAGWFQTGYIPRPPP